MFCFPSYCSYWQWQCYCILPLDFDIVKKGTVSADFKSIVLVVSPLIVLMKDQVIRAMQERNVFSALYAGDLDEKNKQMKVKYVLASIS